MDESHHPLCYYITFLYTLNISLSISIEESSRFSLDKLSIPNEDYWRHMVFKIIYECGINPWQLLITPHQRLREGETKTHKWGWPSYLFLKRKTEWQMLYWWFYDLFILIFDHVVCYSLMIYVNYLCALLTQEPQLNNACPHIVSVLKHITPVQLWWCIIATMFQTRESAVYLHIILYAATLNLH